MLGVQGALGLIPSATKGREREGREGEGRDWGRRKEGRALGRGDGGQKEAGRGKRRERGEEEREGALGIGASQEGSQHLLFLGPQVDPADGGHL